eukprot:g7941.t1
MVLRSAFVPSLLSALHITRRVPMAPVSLNSPIPRSLHVVSSRQTLTGKTPALERSHRLRMKFVARAEETTTTTPDVDSIVKDLTEKWDKVENKSSLAVYGLGAIAVLYVTSSIVSAVNSIPLLPKFLELVGFVYTAWFVYRYLLFKSSREELSKDVDELKAKITGQEES